MSSTDDNDPSPQSSAGRRPRRPRPERDDFIQRHGRRPAPNPQPAEDAADATDAIEVPRIVEPATSPADDTDTEVLDIVDDSETDVETGPADDETTPLPRGEVTTVHTPDEPVTTEPFTDTDDDRDRPRAERTSAEHLTEDPLPYIEPQPTLPIEQEPADAAVFDDAITPPVADTEPAVAPPARRGTIDLGLLILRVGLGVVFLLHGLQKLTGWMNGPGPDGFADFLANASDPSLGFDEKVTKALSLVAGVSETAGGVLLILGLFTPIAGAAVLSSILVALTYKATLAGGLWFFAADGDGNGLEYEGMLAIVSMAVILCGPGLYSVDRRWGWARRPAWGSGVWLLIGIGVAVAVWMVFNGANPLR